ncbi:MAG: hypothetical protein ACYTGC_05740 [Planctomycetota bacterium]|jgi:hypothetical protein
MAIAHVCMGCGFDLSRLRAVPDPYYGIPLVACPACDRREAKRFRMLHARVRAGRRLLVAIRTIVSRLVLAMLLAWAHVNSVNEIIDSHGARDIVASVLIGVYAWIIIGAWFTLTASHWRWWAVLTAWGALIAVLLTVPAVLNIVLDGLLVRLDSETPGSGGWLTEILVRWSRELPARIGLTAASVGVSMLGVPVGRAVRGLIARRLGNRWRHRLVRVRRRRHRS